MSTARLAAVIASAAVALAGTPEAARAFTPPGEGFATSSRGHVAILTPGTNLRTVLRVSDPNRRFARPETLPEADYVALGPRGDALVAGHERVELPREKEEGGTNVEFRLWVAYRPPGGPVGAPVELGSSSSSGENWPALGIDASGTAVILWSADDDREDEPMTASVRQPSGEWLPAQDLGGTRTFRPVLSVSENGLMTASWRQTRPDTQNGSQVAVATRLPGGAFGPASVVAGIQRDPAEPVVASNSRGDAVVAWIETARDSGTDFAISGAFRKGVTGFGRPLRLSRIHAASPAVAVAESGRMTMAWAGDRRVEARVRSAAAALRRPQLVTRDGYEEAGPTVLPSGQGLVAWIDRDPGRSYARLTTAGNDGRFGRKRTVARVGSSIDQARFVASPEGLRFVRDFSRRGRPLLETLAIPEG